MNPTEQQSRVIAYVQDATQNPKHFVVDARAGTGKTSTIVSALQDWQLPAATVAFNKSIATELESRLPSHILARTLNSIGHRSYTQTTRNYKPELDTKKPTRIKRQLGLMDSFPDFQRAMSAAREWGIAPHGAPAEPDSILPDTSKTWTSLFDEFAIDTGICNDPIGAMREGLLQSIKMAWQGVIDFTDQKYMPAIYRWQVPRFPLVLGDEAQDFSPIDRQICLMMLEPGGRLGAVGDQYQAIYGFRGADRQSIPRIIEMLGAEVLPLTMCFRCPKAVILEAQRFVPDIECGIPLEGSVQTLDKLELASIPPGSAFLCRNNKPLIALYFNLIRAGIPARVRGRDIGAAISKMVSDTKQRTLGKAIQSMWQTVGQKIELLLSREMNDAAGLIQDRAECAQIIAERVGFDKSVTDFEFEVLRLFSDEENGGILLSSVHRAKGLEWRNVYILDPFLMPSKYAKTEEAKAQERNLQYVAVTRSQENLFYINSDRIK